MCFKRRFAASEIIYFFNPQEWLRQTENKVGKSYLHVLFFLQFAIFLKVGFVGLDKNQSSSNQLMIFSVVENLMIVEDFIFTPDISIFTPNHLSFNRVSSRIVWFGHQQKNIKQSSPFPPLYEKSYGSLVTNIITCLFN